MKAIIIFGLGLLLLSGCKSDCSCSDAATGCVFNETDTDELSVLSWWTAPGENEALSVLVDLYTYSYGPMELLMERGNGSDAKAKLFEICDDGPPDISQIRLEDLSYWVDGEGDGKDAPEDPILAPLDFEELFWDEDFPDRIYPKEINDIIQHNGRIYAIPVNMHRQNMIFYNKAIASPPLDTLDAFIDWAKTQPESITPLALSAEDGWTLRIVFYTVMAAICDEDSNYETPGRFLIDFFTGSANLSNPSDMGAAADAGADAGTDAAPLSNEQSLLQETVSKYFELLSYANTDAKELDWGEAAELILAGKAAAYINGDWAKGYFDSRNWVAGINYDVAAAPGTSNVFIFNVDTFALLKNNKNRNNAYHFLRMLAEPETQKLFNKIKGSIPVIPTDTDPQEWDQVTNDSIAAFNDETTAKLNFDVHQFTGIDGNGEPQSLDDKLQTMADECVPPGDNIERCKNELYQWLTAPYVAE